MFFLCEDGRSVPISYVCDGTDDCSHGEDETAGAGCTGQYSDIVVKIIIRSDEKIPCLAPLTETCLIPANIFLFLFGKISVK